METTFILLLLFVAVFLARHWLSLKLKQIQLRGYLSYTERQKLARKKQGGQQVVISTEDDLPLLKAAYNALTKAVIMTSNGIIVIKIPVPNTPEVQDYVKAKLDKYLVRWLMRNFPDKHWTQPKLNPKSFFGWEFEVHEK